MGEIEIEFDTREEVVEKTYITIDGEEFPSGPVFEFLETIAGTDGFVTWVTPDYNERDFAEYLQEKGLVGRKANGGWFDRDGQCEELNDRLEDQYIEEFIDD